jgi:hypothetical protein
MRRKRKVTPEPGRSDLDDALETMAADELREVVREVLLELDDRAHGRVVASLIERAWRAAPAMLRLRRWLGAARGKADLRKRAAEALVACPYDYERSASYARYPAHRLAKKGWLERLRPGLYQFVPAERGREGVADTNPLAAGALLVSPYFFSFGTACTHHGLTEQAFSDVFLVTRTRRKPQLVRGKRYVFVPVPEERFFGFESGHVPGFAFFELQEELGGMLGRTVDLHTPGSLSRYFRDEVLNEAQDQYVAA